jgi:hypothetical protein
MIEPTDEDRRNDPSHEQHKLTTEACRYLAFGLVTGQLLARASTARRALILGNEVSGAGSGDFSGIEVLDCGDEGRKIWLHNASVAMPILLGKARKRHTTVFRGDFYASPEWYGSQKPAIPLEDTSK